MATANKLNWREVKGEWRAGPFRVYRSISKTHWFAWVATYCVYATARKESTAKRVCQRLANEIVRAMKPATKKGVALKGVPFPWDKDAAKELKRNGHWAEFAGFERWISRQDDLLDSAYSELDVDTKAALFAAFVSACEFTTKKKGK